MWSLLIVQSERLQKVLELVCSAHDLCAVIGKDFFSTDTEVHPSLIDSTTTVQSKSTSNDTLSMVAKTVLALKEDKQGLHKVNIIHLNAAFLRLNLRFL